MKKLMSIAFVGALTLLPFTFASTARAQAIQVVNQTWTFENAPYSGWWFGGHAGYDINLGFSHSGSNNLWINNWDPRVWNSLNVEFAVSGWSARAGYCDIYAWTQTSGNFNNGFIDLWEDRGGGNLVFLRDQPIYPSDGYTQQIWTRADVSPAVADGKPVLLVFGFWGTGTGQWVRVDDVHVECFVYNRP